MKAARPANYRSFESRRREKVVDLWRGLGEPKVGGDELRQIQKGLGKEFVPGGVASPARIARILADEGAELRHPEIIEFDARWREAQIENESRGLNSVSGLAAEKALSLKQAESLIRKLEKMRNRFERKGNEQSLMRLRTLAIDGRQAALARAKDKSLDSVLRDQQIEIAEWLRIWLQTPNLFEQWLELRKSSPDFRSKFSLQD